MAVTLEALFDQLGTLTTIFQAIGGLIIAYIIFSAINVWHGWKKEKELKKIRQLLEQINKKLGKKK
jgi:Na+/citrate or Na+/malate symporter